MYFWAHLSFLYNITLSAIFLQFPSCANFLWLLSIGPLFLMLHEAAVASSQANRSSISSQSHHPLCLGGVAICSALSLVPAHNNRLQLSRGSSHHCLAIYLSVRVVIIYGSRQVTVVRLWTWRFRQGCSITRRFSLTCTERTTDASLSSGADLSCFFMCLIESRLTSV